MWAILKGAGHGREKERVISGEARHTLAATDRGSGTSDRAGRAGRDEGVRAFVCVSVCAGRSW